MASEGNKVLRAIAPAGLLPSRSLRQLSPESELTTPTQRSSACLRL